jgi:hypothetical protein
MLSIQKILRLSLLLAALVLLASCGTPGTGGAVMTPGSDTGAVPQTGIDTPMAGAGDCVGVDTTQLVAAGKTFYDANCALCHGAEGEGIDGIGTLANNTGFTTASAVSLVEAYMAVDIHPKTLAAEDLAASLSYARGAFGNTGTVICPADIVIPVVP